MGAVNVVGMISGVHEPRSSLSLIHGHLVLFLVREFTRMPSHSTCMACQCIASYGRPTEPLASRLFFGRANKTGMCSLSVFNVAQSPPPPSAATKTPSKIHPASLTPVEPSESSDFGVYLETRSRSLIPLVWPNTEDAGDRWILLTGPILSTTNGKCCIIFQRGSFLHRISQPTFSVLAI